MGLKKDSKGNLTEVTPLRSRKGSIYKKGANETFKISRSKFSSFLDCKRCFYLDRVKGLQEPSMPGWSLNTTVDDLLKKEFDAFPINSFLIFIISFDVFGRSKLWADDSAELLHL